MGRNDNEEAEARALRHAFSRMLKGRELRAIQPWVDIAI
jgi:hypothetical protein